MIYYSQLVSSSQLHTLMRQMVMETMI